MIQRALAQVEHRAASYEVRASGRRLEGFAALFGIEATIGRVRETIAPGAFTKTLANAPDILALADHDPAKVLARTKSGTLRLSQEAKGLAFALDIPDTTVGRDILALAERGDLGGMSFGFRSIDETRDGDLRILREVQLLEISVVQAFPAYDGTSVQARALHLIEPWKRQLASRIIQIGQI